MPLGILLCFRSLAKKTRNFYWARYAQIVVVANGDQEAERLYALQVGGAASAIAAELRMAHIKTPL
jgi:hypothetical protein